MAMLQTNSRDFSINWQKRVEKKVTNDLDQDPDDGPSPTGQRAVWLRLERIVSTVCCGHESAQCIASMTVHDALDEASFNLTTLKYPVKLLGTASLANVIEMLKRKPS